MRQHSATVDRMTNKQKYDRIFITQFSLDEDTLKGDPEYNKVDAWDSIGHMGLIAEIEETFDIVLDGDDIIEFGSYTKGFMILAKYAIEL